MVNREGSEYNILYHNNGDGTFTDKTEFAGVNGTEEKMGLVVVAFDYNNDLWPDIYIGNDSFGHHISSQMGKPSFVILLDTPRAYTDYSINQIKIIIIFTTFL